MRRNSSKVVALLILLALYTSALAVDPPSKSSKQAIRDSMMRGLAIAQKAAANYPKNRNCFSCHHQTLPMLAIVATRDVGLKADEGLLRAQAEFTHQSFASRIDTMKEGKGIGGTSMTVGYGLWALDLASREPDETTGAMVTFLLKNQQPEGHWTRYTSRPPLEDSNVTCTVLAAYGIEKYAATSQRTEVEAAVAKAKTWLATAPLESQEDKVACLWGLHMLGAEKDRINSVREQVLAGQGDDGGWAQLATMKSDAYATGQTLFILRETGLALSDPALERGVHFLLKTQCEDGSWFVETRSKPIQVFFDNGDPHDQHQFISIPATSWAVAALAAAQRD
jgi:N-acyl-D-amino-acid deacylase